MTAREIPDVEDFHTRPDPKTNEEHKPLKVDKYGNSAEDCRFLLKFYEKKLEHHKSLVRACELMLADIREDLENLCKP